MSKKDEAKDFYNDIEAAYRMKEFLDYIDVGSFEKDLERTLAVLSSEKIRYKFDNQKTNAKLGTLIGKHLFFEGLSNENLINKCNFLTDIYLGKNEGKDGEIVFNFENFNVVKKANKITINLKNS